MVSLTLMARLLEAVRPDARLPLVGDPDQLASVEAGAVLGDIVAAAGPPEPALHAALRTLGDTGTVTNGVVTLEKTWRFQGDLAALATAVRAGDHDTATALLRAGGPQLCSVHPVAAVVRRRQRPPGTPRRRPAPRPTTARSEGTDIVNRRRAVPRRARGPGHGRRPAHTHRI